MDFLVYGIIPWKRTNMFVTKMHGSENKEKIDREKLGKVNQAAFTKESLTLNSFVSKSDAWWMYIHRWEAQGPKVEDIYYSVNLN